MALLPPPENRKRGRGRRSVSGSVPPLSPEDISRLTSPEPEDESAVPPPAEVPTEPFDPTRLTVVEQEEFRGVLAEILSRRSESLAIFEPIPEQERFFASDAPERVALGGNRGGKTIAVVVEIARAVTNQDPHDKYGKKGKFILVGRDFTHCSKVFFLNLFRPGAFKIIRDLGTGLWRGYRPNDPEDQRRSHETKDAPPLIPERFYDPDKIAWENKKDDVPKTITLRTGWTLHFFSGAGSPPQGWKVAAVAFDEEIEHPRWYPEMALRLLDERTVDPFSGKVRNGKFIWSATPQAGTQQLYDLKVRGDDCEGDSKPAIQNFMFTMLDNPFLDDGAKREAIEKLKDNEDETAVRIHGQFALLGTRVYSEFMPDGVHGLGAFPIPEDWTSYAVIDPGRQVCAVLFVAVPPPGSEWGGRKIVYDELYIKRCNAKIFADQFVRKVNGRPIEFGIIDHRAGRITEIGSGKTHEQQYTDALKAKGFKFEKGGASFQWSSDDVKAGIESVRNAMHIVEGRSELVVMKNCKWLIWEMKRYSYRRLPNGVVTDEPIKLNDHAADCLRYAFAAKLCYVRPRKRKAAIGYTTAALQAKKERAKIRAQKITGDGGSYKVG